MSVDDSRQPHLHQNNSLTPSAENTMIPEKSKDTPEIKKQQSSFIHKLYSMLEERSLDHLIWWHDNGEHFLVRPNEEFTNTLSHYFKHTNIASFIRQLNMYGFHKVDHSSKDIRESTINSKDDAKQKQSTPQPGIWEFKHGSEKFRRGDTNALKTIKRRSIRNSSAEKENSMRQTYDIPPNLTNFTGGYYSNIYPIYGNQGQHEQPYIVGGPKPIPQPIVYDVASTIPNSRVYMEQTDHHQIHHLSHQPPIYYSNQLNQQPHGIPSTQLPQPQLEPYSQQQQPLAQMPQSHQVHQRHSNDHLQNNNSTNHTNFDISSQPKSSHPPSYEHHQSHEPPQSGNFQHAMSDIPKKSNNEEAESNSSMQRSQSAQLKREKLNPDESTVRPHSSQQENTNPSILNMSKSDENESKSMSHSSTQVYEVHDEASGISGKFPVINESNELSSKLAGLEQEKSLMANQIRELQGINMTMQNSMTDLVNRLYEMRALSNFYKEELTNINYDFISVLDIMEDSASNFDSETDSKTKSSTISAISQLKSKVLQRSATRDMSIKNLTSSQQSLTPTATAIASHSQGFANSPFTVGANSVHSSNQTPTQGGKRLSSVTGSLGIPGRNGSYTQGFNGAPFQQGQPPFVDGRNHLIGNSYVGVNYPPENHVTGYFPEYISPNQPSKLTILQTTGRSSNRISSVNNIPLRTNAPTSNPQIGDPQSIPSHADDSPFDRDVRYNVPSPSVVKSRNPSIYDPLQPLPLPIPSSHAFQPGEVDHNGSRHHSFGFGTVQPPITNNNYSSMPLYQTGQRGSFPNSLSEPSIISKQYSTSHLYSTVNQNVEAASNGSASNNDLNTNSSDRDAGVFQKDGDQDLVIKKDVISKDYSSESGSKGLENGKRKGSDHTESESKAKAQKLQSNSA